MQKFIYNVPFILSDTGSVWLQKSRNTLADILYRKSIPRSTINLLINLQKHTEGIAES
jgi:hypothetical protein